MNEKSISDTEAIVLAGGFGSRLQSVVSDVPKPMASINGSPFLEHLFHYLNKQGSNTAILSVGYKHELIQEYFGDNFNDIAIKYAIEDTPLGTGGGIKLAAEKANSDEVIIINGDTYFDVDLNKMLHFHRDENADISIAVKRMVDFDRYGVIEYNKESKEVDGFHEKKWQKEGFINGGIYILNKEIFQKLDLPDKFSFEKDILENSVINCRILAFDLSSEGYFIDIGIPEDYQRAQYELERI